MAVEVSEVVGPVVSEDVWVGMFVGVAGCGVELVGAAGVEVGGCCAVDSGVCGLAGAVGVVPFSAVGGVGFCCVGGEFGGVLSAGVFDGVGRSWEGRSSDDPVGLGGFGEDVSLRVGVSVVGFVD
ncbi:hypothetical protein ACTWPB_04055 [Nocardia sp. IBHARD005]|uniref:hypothetical protein n=1 Tax=Nocardia sp. IBHARD005 TaxID=3457765 RepID=UPI00405A27C0